MSAPRSLCGAAPIGVRSVVIHREETLLIVEYDQRFADTLALEFQDRGYRVECLDGLEAVEQKAHLSYRYAVIDLWLHPESGLDVISIFKDRSPSTVIAALAGYHSGETAQRAIELGATACLTKPVDIDVLERALRSGDPPAILPQYRNG